MIADPRNLLLVAALLLLTGSILLFLDNKIRSAVFLLFLFALTLYIFAALLDPFLNIWDERFHALVAKNLMNHPLKPTLYDNPVITSNYSTWDRAVIWLHKQPLFLWQMALSMKIFGVSEFALRIPSILMGSLLVPIFYRSGKILVNAGTGYFAALLSTSSYFLFELVSGNKSLDHNDVAFLFYVSASIWAWLEHLHSGKNAWLLLTGLFSGFAVLTKWLVGLLVYSGWGLYILTDAKKRTDKSSWLKLSISFLITCFVAIPWQLWILKVYPVEAKAEFAYTSDHFFRVIEGHQGPWWYYLDNLQFLYGFLSFVIVPAGLVFLFVKIKKGMNLKIAMITFPLLAYIFFSLAKTKMTNFPFVISMPLFIGMACILDFILVNSLQLKLRPLLFRTAGLIFLLLVVAYNLRCKQIFLNHLLPSKKEAYSNVLVQNRKIFLRYSDTLPSNTVLFNLKGRSNLDCMFYTGFPAYSFLPSREQYDELKKKGGYTIVVINSSRNDCPDYLKNDPSVIVLNETVSCFDY